MAGGEGEVAQQVGVGGLRVVDQVQREKLIAQGGLSLRGERELGQGRGAEIGKAGVEGGSGSLAGAGGAPGSVGVSTKRLQDGAQLLPRG